MKLLEQSQTKDFVEVERAIVSRQLAKIYLNKLNDLDKAVEILCDLQVEAYSLMPFSDKIEYILEQIQLTLQRGLWPSQDFESKDFIKIVEELCQS